MSGEAPDPWAGLQPATPAPPVQAKYLLVGGAIPDVRAPIGAVAQTRGLIYRGGVAYYPAPAGLIPDGVNITDEGAAGLYARSTPDILPWEYGALPGGLYTGPDSGAALAAWAAGASDQTKLYLPPGHWWTGQTLTMQRTNLELDFRGTLHASPGFGGYLVDLDAGHTPAATGQLPSYYDTTLGNALWYKRIQVTAMTLNGESHSKGVRFSRFDHFHIQNVTVHKSYGHGIAMDRMREGNAYNFNMLHSRAGPDNAVFDLSEQGPGDSTNVVNYYGVRIAVFTGRAMYYDSPHMTEVESVNPPIGASNLPGRFVNFYGLSVEDIVKGQGSKFDNVTTEFPDPTSDRIWIRRGRYINIRGGLINAGDVTTGSVLRIGDSSLSQPVLSCLVDTDVYAFAGNGYAIIVESAINVNITKEPWLSDLVKPIQDPAGGRVPAENRQPTLTRMPGSQSAYRAINQTAGAGDSPTLRLEDGNGNALLLGQIGTNSGYSTFVLKPAAANNTTFTGDTNGALWVAGNQLKLGSGTNKVAWAMFAPQAGEPYDKASGSIAVGGTVSGWNPLARAVAAFPMFYNGTVWLEVNTGLVPTTSPANLAAAPTAADFNTLLNALRTSKILV